MTKPSSTTPARPQPGPSHPDREAAQYQPDLFDERGRAEPHQSRKPVASSAASVAVETLTDDELLVLLPEARPSNVEAVCAEIVSRSMEAAVPALEALWQRFTGFGVKKPLREQLAVVDTLARLGGTDARMALSRVVLSRSLPASLLPAAVRAAASAGLALPAPFVSSILGHGDAAVRGDALALAVKARVPAERLCECLLDRSAANRRSAAIALGLRGDPRARQPLLNELERAPSAAIIEALAGVSNDDAIVHLGRCARRHPQVAGAVLDALRDIASPRARVVARHLETGSGSSGPGGE